MAIMRCEEIGPILMGYIDNELTGEETWEVESHLQMCARCRSELKEYRELGRLTSSLRFVVPEEEIWKGYGARVYNRIERAIGWILLSAGLIVLGLYGAYEALDRFLEDPSEPTAIKYGVGALVAGLVVLFVSILRERLYYHRRQRYRDIWR